MEPPEQSRSKLPASPIDDDTLASLTSYREKYIRNAEEESLLVVNPFFKCWTVNMRFVTFRSPADDLVYQLHHMWFDYYQSGRKILADSPFMDALVVNLQKLREQSSLSRRAKDSDAMELAVTSDGVIWTDLPFFASEMKRYWTEDAAAMGSQQRVNFSCFLATFACVALVEDKLYGIALMVFRETLETPRPLGELNEKDDEDPKRTLADLSIGDLLPTLRIWVLHCRMRFIQLSHKSCNSFPTEAQKIGRLYSDDSVSTSKSPGFNPERWIFWLRRLDDLHGEARATDKQEMSNYFGSIMHLMLMAMNMTDSDVRRDFYMKPYPIKYHSEVADFVHSGRPPVR